MAVDGYILTYGGFLLLGARMADLLGRRLMRRTGCSALRDDLVTFW